VLIGEFEKKENPHQGREWLLFEMEQRGVSEKSDQRKLFELYPNEVT
jgi:hypothetical protein